MEVLDLRCEQLGNPVGITVGSPRLSWKVRDLRREALQTAYQIQVASDDSFAADTLLHDTGKVESSESIFVQYDGPEVVARERYYWRVRVYDEPGSPSDWSQAAFWETGLEQVDWSARWISPAGQSAAKEAAPSPYLRHDFTLDGEVASARLYVSARGLYEAYLNGARVGDDLLTPGWTSYRARIQYQTYDVTEALRDGANAIGAILGDGWYRGPLGFTLQRNSYGPRLALICQLEIDYVDGRQQRIESGRDGWRCSTGPILSSEMQDGECYDARREMPGWADRGFDETAWLPVDELAPGPELVAPAGPPVRRMEERRPISVVRKADGAHVVDMGQNMVGWVQLRAQGAAGTAITLRHGEVLDQEGNFYTANLRNAKQQCVYTLRGAGEDEVFEPHFTFQGFRYVEVTGFPGELTADHLTGIVIHSEMAVTGSFETSNALLNQFQSNIQWAQRGNFIDVPVDCPQRDERLGWTGDAQVFAPTAAFNMDVAAFFMKWLADLQCEQGADGAVAFLCPDTMGGKAAAGWSDAAVLVPWMLYERYGDHGILASHYRSMQKWISYMEERAGADRIWSGDHQFGDWLDFFSTSRGVSYGLTSGDLVATAYFARSTAIVAQVAELLGDVAGASAYRRLFEEIRSAFCARYVSSDGVIGEDTQTCYAMALEFDLLPPALKPKAVARFAHEVRTRGHLTTGFLGTPLLLDALTHNGLEVEAFMLLMRTECPSWLYPVTKGATTIWERWNAILPDGSFFPREEMNSLNHYAYGAVGDWIYRNIGGIAPDPREPGYAHVIVAPLIGGGLTFARASHESPYGRIATHWRLEEGRFALDLAVPVGARATVHLPGARLGDVEEAALPLAEAIPGARQDGANVVMEVPPGSYSFAYPFRGTPY